MMKRLGNGFGPGMRASLLLLPQSVDVLVRISSENTKRQDLT
jgi:hypothetical protein